MKNFVFVIVMVLTVSLNAQTNVFPATGNVGIGTTNPIRELHIQKSSGTIYELLQTGPNFLGIGVNSAMQFGPALVFNENSQLRIGKGSGISATGATNFRELFRIDNAGNMSLATGKIGIGTSSPIRALHIKKSTGTIYELLQTGPNFLGIGVNSAMQYGPALVFNENSQLRIGKASGISTTGATNFREFLRVDKTGNIGIGTSTPSKLLDVYGDAKMGKLNARHYMKISSKEWPELRFETPLSNENIRLGVAHENHAGYGVSEGDFYVFSGTSSSMPLAVNKTGNISLVNKKGAVGVGTNTPSKLLDVYGDAKMGKLNARHYMKISSKEWPELRFETPSGDENIRLGVAHANNTSYNVSEGDFYVFTRTTNTMPLVVNKNGNVSMVNKTGNVGIGTTKPDAKLTVKGNIHAEEVKIDLSVPAPDYVFKKDYDLLTIEEVQQHIIEKGHLPNIPSASVLEADGVELGMMNMKLLEKIEELTLYTIAQEKKHQEQKEVNLKLEAKNWELETRLTKLEALLLKK
ncbi:tail fiber protein [Aquimarina mytili]|uniref:Peptidase S74 domain-containing protein n=1 Tax=Aquimarina mytili TaxID=874423 RepID=A0A936ZR91_9FLAO|nr:tail fiber protein [Aquimarina mytili]MBL0684179.1 hypothetical protein [Aquimarina mytili]